jgi:hypothetical protein
MVERLNDRVARHLDPAAQIIPERDAELVAGLDETEESIAAISANVASRPGMPQALLHGSFGKLRTVVLSSMISLLRILAHARRHSALRCPVKRCHVCVDPSTGNPMNPRSRRSPRSSSQSLAW